MCVSAAVLYPVSQQLLLDYLVHSCPFPFKSHGPEHEQGGFEFKLQKLRRLFETLQTGASKKILLQMRFIHIGKH